jgi:anti-anti-sigma regulatory factor
MVSPPSVFRIRGPLRRKDLPGLYARACGQLAASRGHGLIVDVSAVAPDAVAVDALARLALAAGRHGCRVSLQGAVPELSQLIELTGLTEVFLSPTAAEG